MAANFAVRGPGGTPAAETAAQRLLESHGAMPDKKGDASFVLISYLHHRVNSHVNYHSDRLISSWLSVLRTYLFYPKLGYKHRAMEAFTLKKQNSFALQA